MRPLCLLLLVVLLFCTWSPCVGLLLRQAPSRRPRLAPLGALLGPVRYTSSDWLHCIQSLPQSKILQRTKWFILATTTWAATVVFVFKLAFSPTSKFHLPTSVHSVLGSALGLLLVFRTNTAYDRFYEARKAQSIIVQSVRNLASLGFTHLPKRLHPTLAALLTCFVCVQRQHLQGVIDHEELAALSPFLHSCGPDSEAAGLLSTLKAKRNRPIFIIRVLEKFIYDALAAKYADPALHPGTAPKYIEKHLTEATNSLGAQLAVCERILKQPVPSQYSRHSSRFLSLYMLTLPFSLVTILGWATVPTVALTCWSFVSIQEIGHYIEEPFDKDKNVINLSQIASVARADVSELLEGVLDTPEVDRMMAAMLRDALHPSDPIKQLDTAVSDDYYMQPTTSSSPLARKKWWPPGRTHLA